MIQITCKRCQAILSNTLKEIVLDSDIIGQGEEIVEEEYYSNGHENASAMHADRVLINTEDAILLDHKKIYDYYGCCGFELTNFLNQICPNCNLGVATIVTECYTDHYLAFQKDKIIIIDIMQ
ncbi:hypothetical protein [uncultured Dokdonia sp.]|uniref:hypothetical protein n=1 Tax=uncultured Dokdonia sp. TaxID=575653 RepID=UPI002605D123|nr:hypothetical protein [uncultured Dokdonia sp.]